MNNKDSLDERIRHDEFLIRSLSAEIKGLKKESKFLNLKRIKNMRYNFMVDLIGLLLFVLSKDNFFLWFTVGSTLANIPSYMLRYFTDIKYNKKRINIKQETINDLEEH